MGGGAYKDNDDTHVKSHAKSYNRINALRASLKFASEKSSKAAILLIAKHLAESLMLTAWKIHATIVNIGGNMEEITNELCRCGREKMPPHCIRCGSKTIYPIKRLDKVVTIGTKSFKVSGWACRRCSLEYTEDAPCAAPVKNGDKRTYVRTAPSKNKTKAPLINGDMIMEKLVKYQQAKEQSLLIAPTECPFCGDKEQEPRVKDKVWKCTSCGQVLLGTGAAVLPSDSNDIKKKLSVTDTSTDPFFNRGDSE